MLDAHQHGVWLPDGVEGWAALTQPAHRHLIEKSRPRDLTFIGIHPWDTQWGNDRERQLFLEDLAAHSWLQVGETGLDRLHPLWPVKQEELFRFQLAAAVDMNRLVCIHCVRSWGRIIDVLRDHSGLPFMIHGFTGSAESGDILERLGGYISIGQVSSARAKNWVRTQARADRILLETDWGGDGNYPLDLLEQEYRELGKARGWTVQQTIEQVVNNGASFKNHSGTR